MNKRLQGFLGGLTVFGSAFCFYFSTVAIRWSEPETTISPAFFVFFRFLLGFVVVCLIMTATRRPPKPRDYHLLVGRTLTNILAVYCFYMGVRLSTVAEANILNMTYPVFVALLSWVLLRQQRDPVTMGMVPVAFAGIWLIIAPAGIQLKTGNLWGLASGLSASASILYLNVSRRRHDVNTVLFFMFGLGSLLTFALFHRQFFFPDLLDFYYLLLCGGAGMAGQFLLTHGFRYVTAVEGGIISSLRILLAALLGPFLIHEDSLHLLGWVGALLLLGSNVVLAVRRGRGIMNVGEGPP